MTKSGLDKDKKLNIFISHNVHYGFFYIIRLNFILENKNYVKL